MKKHPRKARSRTGKPDGASREDRRKPRFSREVSVLYEDDALLVAELKQKRQRPWIVHRIDRFTSGILLFAKTEEDREELVRQFLDHTPVRQYLAVLRGRVDVQSGTLVHYLQREGMFQQVRTERDPEATRAELRYSVERLFADASLVRVELETGLQNQIRAQFWALGHPVIGDRKYRPAEASEQLIDRVALHAVHLEFVHPRTGKIVKIDCAPPPDFQHLVEKLSQSRTPRQ
jgi:23S rRNA pseudouridine1911/1915/1917 synthase